MEDAAELEFAASKLTIVATRVDGDIDNPAYICKVDTESADVWPICRRLSAFAALKETLTEHGNPAVGAIRFPKQPPKLAPLKMLGGLFQQQAPDETVTERREILEAWCNEVLAVCPGDKEVLTFMADDGSVSTGQARDYGIKIVSSNPARKIDVESQPDIAAAQEQHMARQARKNKSALDELDTEVASVSLSVFHRAVTTSGGTSGTGRATAPAVQAPAPATSGMFSMLKQAVAEGQSQLSSLGNQLVENTIGTPTEVVGYNVRCSTKDGEQWVMRKTFKEFMTLAAVLGKDGNPAIRSLAFPHPTRMFLLTLNVTGDELEPARMRRAALEQWLNEAIELAVGGTGAVHDFLDRAEAVMEEDLEEESGDTDDDDDDDSDDDDDDDDSDDDDDDDSDDEEDDDNDDDADDDDGSNVGNADAEQAVPTSIAPSDDGASADKQPDLDSGEAPVTEDEPGPDGESLEQPAAAAQVAVEATGEEDDPEMDPDDDILE